MYACSPGIWKQWFFLSVNGSSIHIIFTFPFSITGLISLVHVLDFCRFACPILIRILLAVSTWGVFLCPPNKDMATIRNSYMSVTFYASSSTISAFWGYIFVGILTGVMLVSTVTANILASTVCLLVQKFLAFKEPN